ncbi:MAG: hypothetical protein ABI947_23445 [Chloroflexota bacterium]
MALLNSPFAIDKPLLKRQLPQAIIDTANPVFDHDLRQVRWFRGQGSLKRGLYQLLGVCGLITVLWLMFSATGRLGPNPFAYRYRIFYVLRFGPTLSLIVSLLADVYYTMITVNSINSQIESGQWDLLRLTTLHEQDILAAKYSTAQLRGWRIMQWDRAFQTVPALINVLWAFSSGFIYSEFYLIFPLSTFIMGFWVPLWRMRAVTALNLAVSSKVHNTTFGALAGLAGVFVLRIALVAIMPILFYLRFSLRLNPQDSFYAITLLSGLITYGLYSVVKAGSLRYALRAAFHPE